MERTMNAAVELEPSFASLRILAGRLARAVFIEGGRFWERGRLAYNGAQLLLTGIMVAIYWPQSRHLFVEPNPATYMQLAIAANILYCAAYLVEAALLIPPLRPYRRGVRWAVLVGGIVFACLLAGTALEFPLFSDPRAD